MPTPRTQQTHQQRVDEIAAEAADKIAAESPVEENVVVTVEELPTTGGDAVGHSGDAVRNVIAPFSPKQYMETMTAVAEANVAFTQRVLDAQLRFAARIARAMVPRSRSTSSQ
jgi:hypothetical protein